MINVNFENIEIKKLAKSLPLLMVVLFISSDVLAVNAMEEANDQIRALLLPGAKISVAVGGLIALVGAVRIYRKWMSGDKDINKDLLAYGGSSAFLILSPMIGITW